MTTTKYFDADVLIQTIRSVAERPDGFIALHEPLFAGNELAYLKECVDTGWVSSVGKFVDRFEADLATFTGAKAAVAVVNGTAALHVALLLVGVAPGDEVLIPTLSFIATANAVHYCGAIPHFCDSDEATLGLDPVKLDQHLAEIAERRADGLYNRSTGRRIAAVVPMHTFGHPVDLDRLAETCEKHGLAIVEDAAESLGSLYRGRHTGTFGLVSAVSFNGNKVITTGGGGAIITNDVDLAKRAKHLTTTAKVPHPWQFYHDEIGFNFRLPNLNAALGCAQLEALRGFLQRKRGLAERYRQAFASVDGVQFFVEPDFARSNYWLNTLLLEPGLAHRRNEILDAANAAGIMARPVWTPLHTLPIYSSSPKMDLRRATELAERIINIPSSASLSPIERTPSLVV